MTEIELTPLPQVCMIYPYYENPTMLALQVENWNRCAGRLRAAIKLIVVDDCSSKAPAFDILKDCKLRKQLFRVKKRLPWNMHQCRNIGAFEAGQKGDNPWLFMSDIDIVMTPEMALTMLEKKLDPGRHYTFERVFAPDYTERKVHPNTFLVKHAAYWQVNGYDLDLTGGYGGGYGGDGEFRRQLNIVAPVEHMNDVVLIGYGRRKRDGEPVIEDADTRDLDRDEWQKKYRAAFDRKRALGDMRSVNPIRVEYEEIFFPKIKEEVSGEA
jgi:hypothetical protein